VKDHNGVEIIKGCRVRQRNVHDPNLGALQSNARREGTVTEVGHTRAGVQFDERTLFDGFRPTDEPRTDRVHAKYLEVLDD
jgi:hypothetical protein